MTAIPWLDDDASTDDDAVYAGKVDCGLSWLACGGDQQDDGSVEFIASTGGVDRMGDVVEQSTWKLRAWRANPVILADHRVPVVGRGAAKVARGEDPRLMLRVWWDEAEVNPVGRLLAHQHRNGFRRAVSVGFLPGEAVNRQDLPDDDPRKAPKDVPRWRAGYIYRHSELLEVSSVAVPANREALQLSLDAQRFADHEQAVERFLAQSVSRNVAANVRDAVRSDPEVRRAVLGLIYSERAPTSRSGGGNSGNDGTDHLWSK